MGDVQFSYFTISICHLIWASNVACAACSTEMHDWCGACGLYCEGLAKLVKQLPVLRKIDIMRMLGTFFSFGGNLPTNSWQSMVFTFATFLVDLFLCYYEV